jgi:hypothetical protein
MARRRSGDDTYALGLTGIPLAMICYGCIVDFAVARLEIE